MPTYIALKAIDILCDILFKYIEQNLPYLLFGNQKRLTSRKSIIRIIGSNLPLPKAPRVTFNLAVWRQNTLSEELSPLGNVEAILMDEVQPKEESPISDTKSYKKLEDELEKLKRQVATILENQRNFSSLANDLSKKNTSFVQECIAPPPPPPPPPPAMLMITPVKLVNSKGTLGNKKNKPSAIDALMTEMKNGPPKLKPIARSPGGRPIKPPRLGPIDPTDALTQALKERFNASQYSDDSADLSSTFITDIQSPSYK